MNKMVVVSAFLVLCAALNATISVKAGGWVGYATGAACLVVAWIYWRARRRV